MPGTLPFGEDMDAAQLALQKEDFYMMNIIGNRIMSNAVFDARNSKPIMLAGFFVKDIAIEMLAISGRGRLAAIGTAKTLVGPYLTRIKKIVLEPKFDSSSFWKAYEEYNERIRKFGIAEIEDKAYSENKPFVKLASKWLLEYLGSQKELLLDPSNQLLEGILNEFSRIFRVHGAELNELLLIALLDYLQKFYAYIRFASTKPDGNIEPANIRSEVNPLVDKITSMFLGQEQPKLEDVEEIFVHLILKWREYFVRYMELRPLPGVSPVRGVELPEETRKKITEAITKTLEKDTKEPKKK